MTKKALDNLLIQLFFVRFFGHASPQVIFIFVMLCVAYKIVILFVLTTAQTMDFDSL